MTANLLYALGCLAAWAGGFFLLRAAFLLLARHAGAGLAAGVGGGLLLLAALTPARGTSLTAVPLVWIVMPFAGWATLACVVGLAVRAFQRRVEAALVWLGLAALSVALYRHDPESRVEVLRGWIDLSATAALALVGLALAATASMALAGRHARRLGGKFAIHATLLAGSVVFGLPFVWLLITSFKEDRDMANAAGLVWIPRVQRTVPYLDPENPLLEGMYRGVRVQATLDGRLSDGSYIVDVQRPSSMSGASFTAPPSHFRVVPKDAPVVEGKDFTGFVAREMNDGRRLVRFLTPPSLKGQERAFLSADLQPVRDVGLRTQNYTEALEAMPPETQRGLLYLRNTLVIVVLSVIGTLLSSSIVAFGFARIHFPGRELLFKLLLATMMLPGAVTLLPQFLLFRSLGWVDTLLPLWVPAFFGSAFNVFLLRQFFRQIPNELEDAGKIDGAGVPRMFWTIMVPQIKPALAVIAIWTFLGAWNNFMGPLIYIDTPENMPLSYAVQLFQSDRGGEPGLMMAFATLTVLPVLALFFFAQRYFVEGVTLSGLGGR